jgi:hypothetical protein
MPDTTPMLRPGTVLKGSPRPKRPERPMKRCPDGSKRPTYAPCPPRIIKSIPREMSRVEQFKRERLGK